MRVGVCCVAAALLIGIPGAAQSPDAPHLSLDDMTLYAHHRDGDDEAVGWMNAMPGDPDSTDIAMGASANYVTERNWRLRLAPATAGEVVLDGDIAVNAYVGGGSAQGVMDVSTQILVDGQAIATGDAQQLVLEPSEAEYELLTWTLSVSTTIPAGAEVDWTLLADNGIATAIFLGVHEDRGKSNIVLPVTSADVPEPAGAGTVYENLTAPPELNLSLTGASAMYVYNWTQADALATFDYDVNGTGNATMTLLANGTVLATSALEGNGSMDVSSGAPGNWSLTLNLEQFNGTIGISFSSPVEGDPDQGEQDDPEGNATNDPDGGNQDAPALAWPLALAGLVAVAVWRRR